jgi:hypothetical protein
LVDSESRVLVLTARSVCDASYFYTETFGERAQIRNERIRVQLADGHALEATRIWVPDEGNQAADLTVLRVEGLPMKYPTSKPTAFAFKSRTAIEQAGAPTGSELRISGEGGAPKTAVPFALDKTVLAEMRGAAVVADDLVFGLVGQVSGADQQPALVTLDILPAAFRPAR